MNLNGIKLTWLGHATFRIQTPGGKTILIDPWVMGNPMCPESEKAVKKVDLMLCTHGHGDHIGDAVAIANQHNPMVVAIYGGEPCGLVIEFSNGVKMYHAGDTAVFGDMQIIRELYSPEIAMLPIGDHYTMSPREAAYACKLLKPKTVIPIHYGTFPVLTGRPDDLKKLVKDVEILEMKPGQTIS
jgi:L-ascorbate metabolism protein UlaG (beta-lactamase superfamily)